MPIIADAVIVNGVPVNGATVNAYRASRFTGTPADNSAAPVGAPDAGPVTSGVTFGGAGEFQITVPTSEDHYCSATFGGHTSWQRYAIPAAATSTVVSAADATVVVAGTPSAPTVGVGVIPESKVTGLVADLAARVTGVTAADATITVAGTASAPTVAVGALTNAKLASGVPTVGQVPTATSATAATWQTPAATTLDPAAALLGAASGQPIQPWALPPPIGPELWVLSNFVVGGPYNSTTLTPSIVGNSSSQTVRTLVNLGNVVNQELCFRVSLNVASWPTPSSGWASVAMQVVDSGGTILAGTAQQRLLTNADGTTGPIQFDFMVGSWGVGGTNLEIRLEVANNITGGTLAINTVSVREIAVAQRPMFYTESHLGAPGSPQLWLPLYDPQARIWRMAQTDIGADGALAFTPTNIVAYNTDRPYIRAPADPGFVAADVGINNAATEPQVASVLPAGMASRLMRVNNNDQIMEVQKADLSYELRCNTHGGESLISTAPPNLIYEVDRGDGVWVAWNGLGKSLRTCRRFRLTWNTQVARSAPDSDVFATTTHVSTWFQDGVMRTDRTTTFTKTVRLRNQFDWMSSHDLTVPKVGRIGSGLLVLDEVDAYPRLAPPVISSVTTNAAGGTLAAATYGYSVAALTSGGETTPSAVVTVTTTGTTSTTTVNWGAVTGAQGYNVYGRLSGVGLQTLIATIAPGTLTYTDTGAGVVSAQRPAAINRARQLDAVTSAFSAATSDHASWSVWYDQIAGMCFGNIFDRDAVLARPNVSGLKVRIERASGIMKQYANAYWVGDGNPYNQVETRSIPSGTVWTVTHYNMAYVPFNPDQYHHELALRAVNVAKLKTIYPST